MDISVHIGFDPREAACFAVARRSIQDTCVLPVPIYGIVLDDMRSSGLYNRQHDFVDGRLWDAISNAPMSTEFAITRFLTPIISRSTYAIFMDCDMMFRTNVYDLFRGGVIDPDKAVSVVKHNHEPKNAFKMDDQIQTNYNRKNWSSFMVFNRRHPANRALTIDLINSVPGRDLHGFCWLKDDEIGELPPEWNYLIGHSTLPEGVTPAVVHWTDGPPCMPGFEDVEYADEFRRTLTKWAR